MESLGGEDNTGYDSWIPDETSPEDPNPHKYAPSASSMQNYYEHYDPIARSATSTTHKRERDRGREREKERETDKEAEPEKGEKKEKTPRKGSHKEAEAEKEKGAPRQDDGENEILAREEAKAKKRRRRRKRKAAERSQSTPNGVGSGVFVVPLVSGKSRSMRNEGKEEEETAEIKTEGQERENEKGKENKKAKGEDKEKEKEIETVKEKEKEKENGEKKEDEDYTRGLDVYEFAEVISTPPSTPSTMAAYIHDVVPVVMKGTLEESSPSSPGSLIRGESGQRPPVAGAKNSLWNKAYRELLSTANSIDKYDSLAYLAHGTLLLPRPPPHETVGPPKTIPLLHAFPPLMINPWVLP